MILLQIQENILKTQNCLTYLESDATYKVYKTLGGRGRFENELRNIYTQLIDLRNSYISHVQAIIKLSENKDLLTVIDSGYFERYVNVASIESLVRIVSLNDFRIPETSLRVIAENKQVVAELQAINNEIKLYNDLITGFRQKRNKYNITLYNIPDNNYVPNFITGTVNIDALLPNAETLANFARNRNLLEYMKSPLVIEPKKKSDIITFTKMKKEIEPKIIKITKKRHTAVSGLPPI